MTEPAERSEAARLDELAAVTKAYGRYFGPSSGLAAVATGAWLLTCECAVRAAPRLGELLFALVPIVWIALATAARTYYQRHGRVVGAENDMGLPYRGLFVVGMVVPAMDAILTQLAGGAADYDVAAVAAVAAFVMIPALASLIARSLAHLSMMLGLTMLAAGAQGTSHHARWYLAARFAFGLMLIGSGIVDHLRYRRLERRLASLNGAA